MKSIGNKWMGNQPGSSLRMENQTPQSSRMAFFAASIVAAFDQDAYLSCF